VAVMVFGGTTRMNGEGHAKKGGVIIEDGVRIEDGDSSVVAVWSELVVSRHIAASETNTFIEDKNRPPLRGHLKCNAEFVSLPGQRYYRKPTWHKA
jgi:hypothetical protein